MRMPERVGCHRRMDGRLLLCSLLMVLPLLLLVLTLPTLTLLKEWSLGRKKMLFHQVLGMHLSDGL